MAESPDQGDDVQNLKKKIDSLITENRKLQVQLEHHTNTVDELTGDLIRANTTIASLEEILKAASAADSGYARSCSTPSFHSIDMNMNMNSMDSDAFAERRHNRGLSRQASFNQSLSTMSLLMDAIKNVCMVKSFCRSEASVLEDVQEQEVRDEPYESTPKKYTRMRSRADSKLEVAYNNLLMFKEKMDASGQFKDGYVCKDRSIDKSFDETPPFGRNTSIISQGSRIDEDNDTNETPVFLKQLSDSDMVRLEKIFKWEELENVIDMLFDEGHICKDKKKDLNGCKYPGSCKLGKEIVDNISNVSLDDIDQEAEKHNIDGICEVVRPLKHRSWSVGDLSDGCKSKLHHQFGVLHHDEEKCWKKVAKGLGMSDEVIEAIESHMLPHVERSYTVEIIHGVKKACLFITLQHIAEMLKKIGCPRIEELNRFIEEKKITIQDEMRYKDNYHPFIEKGKTHVVSDLEDEGITYVL